MILLFPSFILFRVSSQFFFKFFLTYAHAFQTVTSASCSSPSPALFFLPYLMGMVSSPAGYQHKYQSSDCHGYHGYAYCHLGCRRDGLDGYDGSPVIKYVIVSAGMPLVAQAEPGDCILRSISGKVVFKIRGYLGKIRTLIGLLTLNIARYENGGEEGLLTAAVVCNPGSPAAAAAEYALEAVVGPEFVTGSTRMKAGTAQKLMLNMLSTAVMIRLGRVEGNRMVHMQLTNGVFASYEQCHFTPDACRNYTVSHELSRCALSGVLSLNLGVELFKNSWHRAHDGRVNIFEVFGKLHRTTAKDQCGTVGDTVVIGGRTFKRMRKRQIG